MSAATFCDNTSELGGPAFYTGRPESDGCVAPEAPVANRDQIAASDRER